MAFAGLSQLICGCTMHTCSAKYLTLVSLHSALKAPPTFPFFHSLMNRHFGPSEGEHPAIHSRPFLLATPQFICHENVAPRALCQCNPIQRSVCSRSQESLLMHRDSLSAEEPPKPPLQSFACRISRVGVLIPGRKLLPERGHNACCCR